MSGEKLGEEQKSNPISDTAFEGTKSRSCGTQHASLLNKVGRQLNWKAVEEISPDAIITPKVPQIGSDDLDRYNHDVANMVVLPFLVLLVVKSLEEYSLWELKHTGVTGSNRETLSSPETPHSHRQKW